MVGVAVEALGKTLPTVAGRSLVGVAAARTLGTALPTVVGRGRVGVAVGAVGRPMNSVFGRRRVSGSEKGRPCRGSLGRAVGRIRRTTGMRTPLLGLPVAGNAEVVRLRGCGASPVLTGGTN